MFRFLICNNLYLNVQYETDIFVVKMIQIWDYIMLIASFMCANWGQINILGKIIISFHNSRILCSRMVHIRKTNIFVISVSKLKWYFFENCHLHIISVIRKSRIVSYHIFSEKCYHSTILPMPVPHYFMILKTSVFIFVQKHFAKK